MNVIITNSSITVVEGGVPTVVTKGMANFIALRKAALANSVDEVRNLLSISKIVESLSCGSISVVNGQVLYRGAPLHGTVSSKLLQAISDNVGDIKPLLRFLDRLMKNPSSRAVLELYDFLGSANLPILEDGCVLAYKGLRSDYWSISGNLQTRVIKGKVDEQGRIYNGIGEEIEVERLSVDDNRERTCSHGLHVGAYSYASGFANGQLVLVKFDPANAVSVPTDCSCQKLRVCAYTVLEDYKGEKELSRVSYDSSKGLSDKKLSKDEIKDEIRKISEEHDLNIFSEWDADDFATYLSSELWHSTDYWNAIDELRKEIREQDTKAENPVAERIYKYVSKKGIATIRQIQSSMSGYKNLSSLEIRDIVLNDTRFVVGDGTVSIR